VLAVALVDSLDGQKLPFGIDVIGFSVEEGVAVWSSVYRKPVRWSVAWMRNFSAERDEHGISVGRRFRIFGLNANEISEAVLRDDVLGYIDSTLSRGQF